MSARNWLVRSARNELIGPFEQAELVRLVKLGKLRPQDEVCLSEGYWFFLHEAEEVRNQLGMDPAEIHWANTEEATRIYADLHSDTTDPDLHSRETPLSRTFHGQARAPMVETSFVLRGVLLGLLALLVWVAYEIWTRAL